MRQEGAIYTLSFWPRPGYMGLEGPVSINNFSEDCGGCPGNRKVGVVVVPVGPGVAAAVAAPVAAVADPVATGCELVEIS